MPGSMKRGPAIRQALHLFTAEKASEDSLATHARSLIRVVKVRFFYLALVVGTSQYYNKQ